MYQIVSKKSLNATVTQMEILAPFVAKKALAGQFIILRVDENGERIPLTIAGYDRVKGTVKIIFQIVGASTEALNHKNVGDSIPDFVGPLGRPTHVEGLKKVCNYCGVDISEAIAAGDELNDMSMIEAAGLGVAMGNAHSAIKDAANHITLTNDENGLAVMIKKFML